MAILAGSDSVGVALVFLAKNSILTNSSPTELVALVKIIHEQPVSTSPRPLVGLIWPRGIK